ncbi:hypothetical protein [Flaviaesturariibacter amylovorans]|uniref:Uncharacterized protein n=1 Tax=Flaviaesturariibacter amylovorans TaxID=1084520 RepID=A0ABP8GC01_9BACT
MLRVTLLVYVGMCGSFCSPRPDSFGKDDIYVKRLVRAKRDSNLFTGTLTISNPPHTSIHNFSNGIPCGKWEYRFNGDLIHKGEILNNRIIERKHEVRKLLSNDTFLLDHWQEGELPTITYPPFLTLYVLKNDSFFQVKETDRDLYAHNIAVALMNDRLGLKFDYVKISFVDAVKDWKKEFSKEYKIIGQILHETK